MSEEKSNVVDFTGATKGDIPPNTILENLLAACPVDLVAITRDKDGDIHVHTSSGYRPEILWMIENAKLMTMEED